jgi:mRNA-degrading endonuclease RelE of RelBE toxin-antitoxin system
VRYRVELSTEAQKQLARFPRDVRERIERAIDEFEEKDDSRWSNIKALQGPQWKGRYRKKVGPYRIVFMKFPNRGVVEISAILIKSKDTYR